MSLVTQIAALATRVAAEIKLLRTEMPEGLPTYSGTSMQVLVQETTGASWTRTLDIDTLTAAYDISIGSVVVGLGGGGSSTNLAFGTGALGANTTGFGLCAVGAYALSGNETGNYSCAVGYSALAIATGGDNTALGTLAGSQLSTGTSNTFVGRSAGSSVTTGSSNTIVGRVVGTSSMGSTIVLAAGTAERARCDSSGNWGFGTSLPTAKADINGETLRLRTSSTPASSTAAGDAGTLRWDTSALHFCINTDTWKSIPFSAFGATSPGGSAGVPVYVQETEPAAPAIWYKTDADGAVIDILRVT